MVGAVRVGELLPVEYTCFYLGIKNNCIHTAATTCHLPLEASAPGPGAVGVIYNVVGQGGDRKMTKEGESKEMGCDEKPFGGGEATSDGWSEN